MGAEGPPLALPADVGQGIVEPSGQLGEIVGTVVEVEPDRPRSADRRKGAGTGNPDRERRLRRGGDTDRGGDLLNAGLRRRAEGAERDVEAVEPNPADTTTRPFRALEPLAQV